MNITVSEGVFVYTSKDRDFYKPGDAVSAVPTYETWGENNVAVNGRI